MTVIIMAGEVRWAAMSTCSESDGEDIESKAFWGQTDEQWSRIPFSRRN